MVLAPAALQAKPGRPYTPLRGSPGKNPGIYCNPLVRGATPRPAEAHADWSANRGLLHSSMSETNLHTKGSFCSPLQFRPAKPFGESLLEDYTTEFHFSFLAKNIDDNKAYVSPTEVTKSPGTTKSLRTELGSTTSPSISDRSDDESLAPQSTNSFPSTSPRSVSEGEMEACGASGGRPPHWEQTDFAPFFSSRTLSPRMDPCVSSNGEEDKSCQELLRPCQLLADQTLEPAAFAALLGEGQQNHHPLDRMCTRRATNYEWSSLDAEMAELAVDHRCERARIRVAINNELRCLDAEMKDLTCDLLDLKRHVSEQQFDIPN